MPVSAAILKLEFKGNTKIPGGVCTCVSILLTLSLTHTHTHTQSEQDMVIKVL